MFLRTLKNFPDTSHFANLRKSACRHTESNAFLKSTKIAYTGLLSFLYFEAIVFIVRIWSYVWAFFVNPS